MTYVYKRGGRTILTSEVNTPDFCGGTVSDVMKTVTEGYLTHCEREADRLYAEYLEDTDPHKRFRLRTKRMSLNVKCVSDIPKSTVLDIISVSSSGTKGVTRLQFRCIGRRMLLLKCENLQQRNNI